jgi:hypothetical protein
LIPGQNGHKVLSDRYFEADMARTISTTVTGGLTLAAGDNPLTIAPGGYVGGDTAIAGAAGTSWTITNQNSVVGQAHYGVSLADGGTITNEAGAVIAGSSGIYIGSASAPLASPGSVSNAGQITASSGFGFAIYLKTIGQVSNATTGTIQGGWGIRIAGPGAQVDNHGLIAGTYAIVPGYGVYLNRGGTVLNGLNGDTAATIEGLYALKMGSQGGNYLGTVRNQGTIATTGGNYAAVGLFQGGEVTNGTTGSTTASIEGGRWGVSSGLAATITNFATILAGYAQGIENGVYVSSGTASVSNVGAGALISGYIGVNVAYGTVFNSGKIASAIGATGTAVNFIAGSNLLVVDPAAAFVGTVAGARYNTNRIELTGNSAGTMDSLGTSFTNFGSVSVDAGATWTLTGAIAIKDTAASGAVSIGAGADLEVTGSLTTEDAFTLSGGTLHLAGTVAVGSSFDMTGAGADTLRLDAVTGTDFANAITGFGANDTIDVPGVTFAAGATISASGGTLSVPLSGGGNFTFDQFTTDGAPNIVTGANSLRGAAPIACFAEGTRIRTTSGEVAVEALRPGDTLTLADGENAAIIWVGCRTIDCRRHPHPELVTPVRIVAGALGFGLPARDLMLSPDHALYLDGGLVPARLLINHASIVQDPCDRVTYYHVELPRHDLLLAEGVAAESYLDTGNRAAFENADRPLALHPDFVGDRRAREIGSCVPLLVAPERVAPIWRSLAERAERLGWRLPAAPAMSDGPDLRLLAGTRYVDPLIATSRRYVFMVPRDAGVARIVSRSARPCDVEPWVDDRRQLGVRVRRLTLRTGDRTREIALDDPSLRRGWWEVEWDGSEPSRWTDGAARLPALDGGLLTVELAGTMRYSIERRTTAAKRRVGSR